MPNTFFQFKQFTVNQQQAAMKVCTDACLFGAWVANKIRDNKLNVEQVLDIGAGTGLLSLMIAQVSKAQIDAVEIDEQAAQQAKENFEASQWKERLQVITGDIRTVKLSNKYNLVIANPPFFENDLQGQNARRNIALHSSELTLEELAANAEGLLKTEGFFAVLLPFHRTDFFIQVAAEKSLFVVEKTMVKQTENHSYFRSMLLFSRVQVQEKQSEIIIKNDGTYSSEFIELLKDYYLYLQT